MTARLLIWGTDALREQPGASEKTLGKPRGKALILIPELIGR